MLSDNKSENINISFLKFFRLVFVFFSLYLMGDVFYRWDGYKLYISFSEYLSSVALASILWSVLAIFIAVITWAVFNAFEWSCKRMGLKIKIEHILQFLGIFVILLLLTWICKQLIWSLMSITYRMHMTFQMKLIAFMFLSCVSMFLAWAFRNKAAQWINAIQERITPLIWLFGSFVIISVFFVGYKVLVSTDRSIGREYEPTSLTTNEKPPNILLVTFDALTAKNMSVYGYHRPTTPFINEWAKTASLFTKTESEGNFTGPTSASLMTGKRIWTHRQYHQEKAAHPYRSSTENLALILKENGYFNSAFVTNFIASVEALNIARSFDIAPSPVTLVRQDSIESFIEARLYNLFGKDFQIHNWLGQDDFIFSTFIRNVPLEVPITEYPPEKVFNQFLKTVEKHPSEPFFAWIHVFPPHDPYLPPQPFSGIYNSSQEMREKNAQNNFRVNKIGKHLTLNKPYPEDLREKMRVLRDYYDEFILYCDKQFETFINQLEEKDILNDTVVILSADHGESFEHDYFYHGGHHLYEQVTSIPLIIKEPGQTEGRIISDLVEQIDIPATILGLTNTSIPSWMEGRSLVPLLRGGDIPSRSAIAMSLLKNDTEHPITTGTFAVWEGDYKLIHYFAEERSLLYNLMEDPGELNNLIDKEPATGRRLLDVIKSNLEKANERILSGK